MFFEIRLRLGDQFGYLVFILCFYRFRRLQFLLKLCDRAFPLTLCPALISPDPINLVLKRHDLVRTVFSQTVDLCLNLSHMFFDRLAKLQFLLSR